MRSRSAAVGVTFVTLLLSWTPVEAQRYPLAPRVTAGENIHPFFEGWYSLPDGRKVFSFGYFNRNLGNNATYIPLGEDNFLEPAEFDGAQPEWFPIRRERGVFAVTVPADWPIERPVTWSFRSRGEFYSVSGTWRTEAMELTTGTAAMGSHRPFLKMDPDGEEGFGIMEPVWGEPRPARVGEPFELTVWARDQVEPDMREEVAVRATLWVHQGPGSAIIVADQPEGQEEPEPRQGGRRRDEEGPGPNSVLIPLESEDGAANFNIRFEEPGEYLLRVMIDNHEAVDSSQGNQCCWTNGYVEVSVQD